MKFTLLFAIGLFVGELVEAQLREGVPTITAYGTQGCVNKGDNLTITGFSFSDNQRDRRVVLTSSGVNTEVLIVSWDETQIIIKIPSDARVVEGRMYQVGLLGRLNKWASNLGPPFTICVNKPVEQPRVMPPPPATTTTVRPSPAGSRAREIATTVAKASGSEHWPQVQTIEFTFNVEQSKNLLISARHIWDVQNGTDLVTWGGRTVSVNVQKPGDTPDEQDGYQRWVNDSYWLLAPLKLTEDGVILGYEGWRKVEDKTYHILTTRFEPPSALPASDRYNFYIDPKTYLVARWDYMPGEGKKTSGTWENYQDFGGLKLSTEHKFGDKHIWFSDIKVETK